VLDSVDWACPSLYHPVHGTSEKYTSCFQVNVPFCIGKKYFSERVFQDVSRDQKNNVSGVVNFGLSVIMLKQLELRQKRVFVNMYKTNWSN